MVVAGWLAIAAGATLLLPGVTQGGSDLEGFISADNPAVAAEIRSFEAFGFPLLSRTLIVQRDEDGLSAYAQAEAVLRAIALSQGSYDVEPILGALPLPNTLSIFPGAQESGTTVLTYLFLPPYVGFADQRDAALAFADAQLADPDDAFVGVTGSIPARAAQAELLGRTLHLVEVATVAIIALIVALAFKSIVAPALTLLVGGVATAVTLPVVNLLGAAFGVSVPQDIRPVLIALLLGTVTDYGIFFLSSFRGQLDAGLDPRDAAREATARTTPIVLVAGVTVAAGTGALIVAESALFRGFGPGMALTVLLGLTVAITLVPALMAVLGGKAFWPGGHGGMRGPDGVERRNGVEGHDGVGSAHTPPRSALAVVLTRPRNAAVVTVACLAGLVLAALPLLHLQLGLGFVSSLPGDAPVAVAAQEAQQGFVDGILSPTELLLEGEDVALETAGLAQLTQALQDQPGVASVVGPGYVPVPEEYDVFLAGSGNAARFLLVFDSPGLGANAIDDVSALQDRLPGLLADAGIDARASLAGDSALSAIVVADTTDDLLRISLAALVANLIMLTLFLRALLTSIALLATSVLALAASLGLTVLVFQDLLGTAGLTFYVPFAAAVLLVSLGSDYNIFAVGRVWDEAQRRPLREAIRVAMPESTRAITAAGVTLAATFGLLALVPLQSFRELAFAMVVGILLDAVVVRSLLLPSILTLLGDRALPARRRAASRVAAEPVPERPVPVPG